MPGNKEDAIRFLETQWSGFNENKIKGVKAETEFRFYLEKNNVHFIPGGWILSPTKNSIVSIPSQHKICLLPIEVDFSWALSGRSTTVSPPSLTSAYLYFRQLGVTTYFVEPRNVNEAVFENPVKSSGSRRAVYPRPYELVFKIFSPDGRSYDEIAIEDVFRHFPCRNGNIGLRCYEQGRLVRDTSPWNDDAVVRDLFWFEYTRYYCQVRFQVSSNDLDLFIIGGSGSAYPVEMKSKSPVIDNSLGDWFGLDVGPFAKMTFFTANGMNTDALYIVQEVDDERKFVSWLGIKFTDLVKCCSWVFQSGGAGMSGANSSTIKVPKLAFTELPELLKSL